MESIRTRSYTSESTALSFIHYVERGVEQTVLRTYLYVGNEARMSDV